MYAPPQWDAPPLILELICLRYLSYSPDKFSLMSINVDAHKIDAHKDAHKEEGI
jgi:hypothetical protein